MAWHAREVSCHGVEIVFPEFADEKEVFVNVCGEICDELGKKVFGEMFDCVETYSAEKKVVAQPVGPVFDLVLDLVLVWCSEVLPRDGRGRYQQTSNSQSSPFLCQRCSPRTFRLQGYGKSPWSSKCRPAIR